MSDHTSASAPVEGKGKRDTQRPLSLQVIPSAIDYEIVR